MLLARDLQIDVGPRTLLSGADFAVQAGDKIGLVGRNGTGKTTLLTTLIGRRSPTTGTVMSTGRVGYFSQEAVLPEMADPDTSAIERILAARDLGETQRRIEETRETMESATGDERERLIKRFARLQDEFEARGGYPAEAEAKQIAASVGIGNDELHQPVATMSGGQRRRVELARILFTETDVLLLDEPTNHIDLDAKDWLMSYLADYKGGLLVVSHDLPLLDQAITSVLSLEGGKIETYKGNYTHFLDERERRRQQRLRDRRQQDLKLAQLETTINRFKGKTEKMARKAKTLETRAQRIRRDLVQIDGRSKQVSVRFPEARRSGQTPITGSGLAKSYGDNLVFDGVAVDTNRGERLIVMGLNGAGKTTLLRILAGVEQADAGLVSLHELTLVGYYAQEHEQIHAGVTVLDHMRDAGGISDVQLRTLLGHFLLADKIDQDATTLSGGEKTKLALAMLMVNRPNVLLLDEPTNNLDPQAKDALLLAIEQYQGTVILVSHDTDFVAALAPDRAIIMPEGDSQFFDESMLELVALT